MSRECPTAQQNMLACKPANPALRSHASKRATHLQITNGAREPLRLAWIDYAGVDKPWGVVAPGATRSMNTFVGHAWRMLSVAPGGDVVAEMVVEADGEQTFTVEACEHRGGSGSARSSSLTGLGGEVFAPVNVQKAAPFSSAATLFPWCLPGDDLGEAKVPGFWVLCAAKTETSSTDTANAGTMVIGAWQNLGGNGITFEVPISALGTAAGMRYCIRQALQLKREPSPHDALPSLPDFTVWTSSGSKQIHLAADMLRKDLYPRFFLFEGGNFVWPGIEVGHERKVATRAGLSDLITFKTVSLRPLVFEIDNFLKPEECDHIIDLAKPHMGASIVNRMDGDEGKSDTTWRTSTTHFLSRGQTDLAKRIERRIFDATRVPISHGEGTQVLRYERSQHYYTHHDFFEPSRYSNSKSTLNMIEHGAKNRLATVFWYMSDVEEGGQTNFPRAGGLPAPSNTRECRQGLLVEARRGKVIVFFNMLPSGELDHMSLHAGCSVKKGIKWAANKWLWNKPTRGLWKGDSEDEALLAAAMNAPQSGDAEEIQAAKLIDVAMNGGRGLGGMDALKPDGVGDIVLWQLVCLALVSTLLYFFVCRWRGGGARACKEKKTR